MADHVVVPTEACRYPSAPCGQNYNDPSPCYGCLGDGTRAVLDQATPVERSPKPHQVTKRHHWTEVES